MYSYKRDRNEKSDINTSVSVTLFETKALKLSRVWKLFHELLFKKTSSQQTYQYSLAISFC